MQTKTDAGCCTEVVRELYGQEVISVVNGGRAPRCGSRVAKLATDGPVTRDLYSVTEASDIPREALLASVGCGNPTALARLKAGQVVLDLGSGGGTDVLLAARRVGLTGKVYGLDVTHEMLNLARENQRRAGIRNVEFIEGRIENVPLADASVNVVISNCAINLSPDKVQVLREAFRVLKPGGCFAVSDIVLTRTLPTWMRQSIGPWAGCITGALLESEYHEILSSVGFMDIVIEPLRIYVQENIQKIGTDVSCSAQDVAEQQVIISKSTMSAFIRARRPRV